MPKPHHGSAPPAVSAAAAAGADTNGQLPPPPDRASAAQGPALPPAPALPLPPPPQPEQRVRAVSPKSVQAPKYAAAQALVGPKKKFVSAQQQSPSVTSDLQPSTAAAAAAAAQRDVNLLYVIEDREPLPQRLLSKSTELPAGNVTKTATAPVPSAVASDSAVRPAATRDSTAAGADHNKPSQSFDGKQSFISLDVEEAPVTGPPSIEQPSSAAAQAVSKADAQGDAGKKARPGKQPTQQAEPMDLDSANPSTSAADLPALNQARLLGAAPTPATTTAGKPAAAAAETDARAIKPDLLSGSSQSRPASAASQGLAAAEFSEAETGQKLLAASRSKAAGKGNIQIVLATKHKQVQAFTGCSCELYGLCAHAVLCMIWSLVSSHSDAKTSVQMLCTNHINHIV